MKKVIILSICLAALVTISFTTYSKVTQTRSEKQATQSNGSRGFVSEQTF